MDPDYFANERRRDCLDLILAILAATAIAVGAIVFMF